MNRPKTTAQRRTEKRATDRALRGLVAFLVLIVCVACGLAYTAIHRQSQATCYQLISVEQTADREEKLAAETTGGERAAHLKSLGGLRQYAGGLRTIVPGCPVARSRR